jgi:putative colanic acid biosynthesis UDP-glucose lipid carrier transferase
MFDATHPAAQVLPGAEAAKTRADPVAGRSGREAAQSGLKRTLDVCGAGALLLMLLPLLLLIALAVALDSRGPILFRQTRTGLNGKPFQILKFRSMRVMEDGEVVKQATRHDNRITRVGGFLRRSSLDELPQLINVLRGDMSLVGPRPHALAHDRYFGDLLPDYGRRFRTRPGITGLSQVSNLRGETKTIDEMRRRIETDNRYIDDWSIRTDASILIRTAVLVWKDDQAY